MPALPLRTALPIRLLQIARPILGQLMAPIAAKPQQNRDFQDFFVLALKNLPGLRSPWQNGSCRPEQKPKQRRLRRKVMSLSKKLVGIVGAGLLGLGMLSGNSAKACDDYREPAPCYRQVWVTDYCTREVPYQVCVTAYDHCGNPYHVYRTAYRTVSYPVRKLVTVSY
jgi:hypothetical protein